MGVQITPASLFALHQVLIRVNCGAMIMPMKNMLTVTEAAERLRVSRQRMHVLIKSYGIKTQNAGPIMLIDEKDLSKIPSNRPTGVRKNLKSRV